MKKIFKNIIAANLLFLTVLIFNQNIILAEIRYVSKTGTSIPPYTSWATAADSIQKCIDISQAGDTIYVANGIYEEQIVMVAGLALIGAGMDSCIIDTRNIATPPAYYTLQMKDECNVEGFHIIVFRNTGGASAISCRPGINDSITYSGKIANNQISLAGDGIRTSTAYAAIHNNIFRHVGIGINLFSLDTAVIAVVNNNYMFGVTSKGIGTSLAGRGIIYNNYIETTGDFSDGIAAVSTVANKIMNNLIYNNWMPDPNSSQLGIYVNVVPDEAINNVVLVNHHLVHGGYFDEGIRFSFPAKVKNNLVIGADRGYYIAQGNQNIFYNNAWNCNYPYYGFTPDSTNLNVDPMVVNDDTSHGDLDFHLQMFSPLIDAGDPSILDKDSTRSDIGLYGGPYGESYIYQDLPPRIPKNFTAFVDTNGILLSWNNNTESDFFVYRLYRDTTAGFQIDSTNLISEQPDTFFMQIPPPGAEKLYYKVTSVDKQGLESSPSNELSVIISSLEEAIIVSDYILYQNYPNPFNPSTKIAYQLKDRSYVKLYVYDIKGEQIATLVNREQERGYYEVEFGSSSELSTGVYIYQIMIKNNINIPVFTDIKKMIYIK